MVGAINPPATGGTLEEWRDKHLTTASGYGDPVPQEERCREGEKGGRLDKKASGQLVDPESASATAPARDGEAQPTGFGAGGGSGDSGSGSGDSESEAASVTGSRWVGGFVGLVGVLAFLRRNVVEMVVALSQHGGDGCNGVPNKQFRCNTNATQRY